MSDAALLLWLLGLISACVLILTVTLVVTARQARRTLRHLDVVLPDAAQAAREARRVMQHSRRLLVAANQATGHVEAVIRRACDAVSAALDQFDLLKERTIHVLTRPFGNGTGAGPRPHDPTTRTRRGHRRHEG